MSTISVNSKTFSVFGDKAAVVADLAFGSSYAFDGDGLDHDQQFGLHDIEMALLEPKDGYTFQHDAANKKIKVFQYAPPVIYEEHQVADVTTGAITLDYPAAFLMNVATYGQNLALRSTGIALASLGNNQACLSAQMAAGVRTGLTCNPNTDELGGDGAFTGGTTNWTFAADPWTYGTNNLEKDADGTDALTHDTFAATVGRTYKLTVVLAKQGAEDDVIGTITPTLGGTAGAASTATAGTYTWNIKATTTDGLSIAPTNTSRFVIDGITIACQDVFVTYATQAWKEVWDNLVQDETLTLATGANTLSTGNKILACMYIDQTTATAAALAMVDEDDTAASGEIEIAFNAATAQLTANSAQNAKAIKTTYIKVPDSGFLFERLFHNETATKVGSDPYLNTFSKSVLLWGYAGQLPVNGGTTQRMIDYASTPGAGEFTIDFFSGNNRGTPTTPTAAGASHNHAFTGTAEAPIMKVEEVVSVAANVGTLAHVPLYIISAHVTAGGGVGPYSVIPTGETPLSQQVAVNFTTGGLAFLAADAVTTVKVTYIPKRSSGFLSSVTVDEAVVAAAAKTNLAARAGLVQYVWDDTDGVLVSFEQPGTAPSATHFCTVDINDSGNSSIDSHGDDEGNALKVTYVPFTQLPPGCFVDDTDITLNSEAWNFTGDPLTNGYNNLVVPGFGTQAVGETGAAARSAITWEGPSGSASNNIATWNPATNTILTNQDAAMTILTIPWMILSPLFLTPATPVGSNAAEATHTHAITATTSFGTIFDVKSNVTGTGAGVWGNVGEIRTVPLEVKNGEDLSTLTSVKGIFIGT